MDIKYFYKYYTINQNFLNSIVNNELYFSNPRNFNDPFDSLPRIKLTDSYDKLKRFYIFLSNKINLKEKEIKNLKNFEHDKERIKTLIYTFFNVLIKFDESYNIDSSQIELKLIEIFTFYNDINNFEIAYKINKVYLQSKMYLDFIFLSIDIDKYGITCGSKSSTCPVMWGHYGNNHTGICLKISFQNEICLEDDVSALDVYYSDNPLEIFDYKDFELDDLILKIFRSKSQKWEYEKEIRLIKREQGLVKIKKKCISQIIFGCRSSPKDRYTICKLFASLQYQINDISIAKIQPDNYELKIESMLIEDLVGSGVIINDNCEKYIIKN
ncbi:DUF2971 domain-containing protein [uncultured Chryseobacterium sp.]|uniref:DUF2971 domain-containing protein n=1 Tax=uncultured Chryseobacterium sp. TaxID=259322 RepID=UPI0025FFEE7D|nr:DUF2971 domain-containing protein [uncultured Chryseobacterium sp.]